MKKDTKFTYSEEEKIEIIIGYLLEEKEKVAMNILLNVINNVWWNFLDGTSFTKKMERRFANPIAGIALCERLADVLRKYLKEHGFNEQI